MLSNSNQTSPSVTPERQRSFGPAENALMVTSLRFHGYTKVGEVLHLNGPYIPLDQLQLAVKSLQNRHPFLRSRLQNGLNPDTYVMEEDSTLCLKVVEISGKCDNDMDKWRQLWKERERDTAVIGQGLVEFWLLQDPDKINDENCARDIVMIAEHSICDGLSLSSLGHELLIALADENKSIIESRLEWPETMEAAIKRSYSMWRRSINFSKLIIAILQWRTTHRRAVARVPFAEVDFPLNDIAQYSHTEIFYGILSKQETQKLIEKCHQYDATVTSAVTAAVICAIATLEGISTDSSTQINIAFAADTRRRCIPPIPNYELSYHVSGALAFTMPTTDIPKNTEEMWLTANKTREHLRRSVDAGRIPAIGMIMGKVYEKNMGPIDLSETPTCGISSWGNLPFQEQYGKWSLTSMIPLGNLIRAPLPFVFIQTVNGTLTVAWMGSSPIITPTTLKNLCDNTMSKLLQMVND